MTTMLKFIKFLFNKTAVTVKPCDEAIDRLVLRNLNGRLGHHSDVGMNGYDPEYWNNYIEKEQTQINTILEWARTQERCVAKAYINWLDFYQRRLDEVVEEFHTQKRKKEMDKYRSEQNKEGDRVTAYVLDNGPIPSPFK